MARVFATARSAELADNPVAVAMLRDLAAEGSLARLPLAAFDEWSMLQLVQRLSGSEGGVRFAARLGAATGGNVFFALETIRAPLVAVNSADDEVNPPELGILEREIRRVPHGRMVLLPITDQTRGHGTHSWPAIWQGELAALLRETDQQASASPAP